MGGGVSAPIKKRKSRPVNPDARSNWNIGKKVDGVKQWKEFERSGSTVRFPIDVVTFSKRYPAPHPTAKPIPLCEWLIKTYSNAGETVLDNCMGSGTTGIACMRTGRKFIGIELSPKYFEVAKLFMQEEAASFEFTEE